MFSILLLLGAHIVHGHGIQAYYVWNISIIKSKCSALQMSRVQLVESFWIFPVNSKVTNPLTLGRLTKVYDVTIPIYRGSQTKTNVSKMHFLLAQYWIGVFSTNKVNVSVNNGISVTSLAPGKSRIDFKNVIFIIVLLIGNFSISYDNALRWMSRNLTKD